MRGKSWAREEEEKGRIAHAWYVEGFARTKKLPPLERLLAPQDELAGQSPDDMLAVLLAAQAAGAVMTIEEVADPWSRQ